MAGDLQKGAKLPPTQKLRIHVAFLKERVSLLETENEKLKERASETYRVLVCPKCGTEFADDGKEHPSGVICPCCTGDVKGVIHPHVVKRFITQLDWDTLQQRVEELEAELE